jgi:hypothetical protein
LLLPKPPDALLTVIPIFREPSLLEDEFSPPDALILTHRSILTHMPQANPLTLPAVQTK